MPVKKAPPPKPAPSATGLEVSQRQVILIMQRRPGELHTVEDFLTALKKPVEIFDNRAAVIGAVNRAEEHGKCERGWLGTGAAAKTGWKVKPPEYRDPAVDGAPKR